VQRSRSRHPCMIGLRTYPSKVTYVTYGCTAHINSIHELWFTASSNFALHHVITKFLSKYYTKRVLDTVMNGYHFFNFKEKLVASYRYYSKRHVQKLVRNIIVNRSLGAVLSLIDFPKAMCMTFQGGAKRFRGRCAPCTTPHDILPCFFYFFINIFIFSN
jgi:hypothetical protein